MNGDAATGYQSADVIAIADGRSRPCPALRTIVALMFVGVGLTGCIVIPQPHDLVELSRVEGVMLHGDVPAANVTLTMNALSNHEKCADPIARAQTDEQGYFVFPEIRMRKFWRIVVLAPSSPTHSMTVCLLGQADVRPIFDERIWAALPTRLVLECDRFDLDDQDNQCRVTDWTGYNYLEGGDNYGQCRPEAPDDQRVLDGGTRISCEKFRD